MNATKALEKSGIIGLGYIEIGFRNLWNNNRAVSTLEDAKGLKIRSTPSKAHIATLKALGMNPTPISWGEVYTAMQQKTVDGIDIDLNLAWFNNFPEVNNHVTIVNSLFSPHLVMISKRFLESLTAEQKELVLKTFDEIKLYERKLIRDGEEEILAKLSDKGVTVTVLTPEERQRWAEATKGVYSEFENRIGKDLIEKAKATIASE
jgi:TRAP-type C4-dicarboxylate transport system substrate-binding protein